MKRQSGILMPVFSLYSEYGIGDFGKGAYGFVDFMKKAGQSVWQILPLVQTGYGNSPYSSVCSYSYNPYFISPDILEEKGLVTEEEKEFCKYSDKYVDYGFLYSVRLPLLKKAYSRFDKTAADFTAFKKRGEFYDYALYMSLKYASGQKHFYEWEDRYKYRDKDALGKFADDYAEEIDFWQFVQYEGQTEWRALKKYANENGIEVFGDLPLYCALDSVDVWQNRSVFKMSDDFVPSVVSGVPPDFFSEKGQLWGNPVYDYAAQQKDGFKWWTDRLERSLLDADIIRIDHFRGLDRYYEIPAGSPDATCGKWADVPSRELFDAIHKKVDKKRIVAEDLGIIDDGVRELLAYTGYSGMKILSFAFNGEKDNLYLPEKLPENSVCYTGTHDNDTLKGYLAVCNEWDRNNFVTGVRNSVKETGIAVRPPETDDELIDAVIELGMKSKSRLFIMPLQDILKSGSDMRINEPGTVKPQNWAVRFNKEDFSDGIAAKLLSLTEKYDRCQ